MTTELLNGLGVNTYACKYGHENRFHDMAKIIESMNTRTLTGESFDEAILTNPSDSQELLYEAQTHLYDAISKLEELQEAEDQRNRVEAFEARN
jgi:hypothetical protein